MIGDRFGWCCSITNGVSPVDGLRRQQWLRTQVERNKDPDFNGGANYSGVESVGEIFICGNTEFRDLILWAAETRGQKPVELLIKE